MTGLTRAIVAAAAFLWCGGVGFARQAETVEWEHANGVTPDKEAILRLARRLGIAQPRIVSFTAYLPSFCPVVRVESIVTVEGNRRSWLALLLRQKDWRACTRVPRFSTRGEGRWRGSRAELSTEEEWRIAEGDWFIDIRLGEGVAYDDAKRIVLAIRNGALANRLPSSIGALKLDTTMPEIDASEIRSITVDKSNADMYQVTTGRFGGLLYRVRIRDGTVELHGEGSWFVHLERPRQDIVLTAIWKVLGAEETYVRLDRQDDRSSRTARCTRGDPSGRDAGDARLPQLCHRPGSSR
jgi:hypothetical protein